MTWQNKTRIAGVLFVAVSMPIAIIAIIAIWISDVQYGEYMISLISCGMVGVYGAIAIGSMLLMLTEVY